VEKAQVSKDKPTDPFAPNDTASDGDESSSPIGVGIIVGIIGGCVMIMVIVVGALVFNSRSEERQVRKSGIYLDFDGEKSTSSSEKFAVSNSSPAADPGAPFPHVSLHRDSSDLSSNNSLPSGADNISTDTSLYTTEFSFVYSHGESDDNNSASSPNSSYLQYDVSRLDKVIAAAKQSSSCSPTP
jgi:hypothetical protein